MTTFSRDTLRLTKIEISGYSDIHNDKRIARISFYVSDVYGNQVLAFKQAVPKVKGVYEFRHGSPFVVQNDTGAQRDFINFLRKDLEIWELQEILDIEEMNHPLTLDETINFLRSKEQYKNLEIQSA